MNTKIFTSTAQYDAAKVYVNWIPGEDYVAPHFTFINDDDDDLGVEYHNLQSENGNKKETIDGYTRPVSDQGTHKYEDTVFCELESDDQAIDVKYLATIGITAVIDSNGQYKYTALISHQNIPVHEGENGKKYYTVNGQNIELKDDDVTEYVGGNEVIDVNMVSVLEFHKSIPAIPGYYLDKAGNKYDEDIDTWVDNNGLFAISPEPKKILLKFVEAKDRIPAYYSYVGDNNTVAILLPEEEDKLETDEEGNIKLYTTITHENALVETDPTTGTKYITVNGNRVTVNESNITHLGDVEVTKAEFQVWLTYHPAVPAIKAHYEDEAGNHYHPEDETLIIKPYPSKNEWKWILIQGTPCIKSDLEDFGSTEDFGSDEDFGSTEE